MYRMNKRKKVFVVCLIIIGLIIIGNLSVPERSRSALTFKERQKLLQQTPKISISGQEYEKIKAIQDRYSFFFFLIPGVVGHGLGNCNGRWCIVVYLERETIASKLIPRALGGFLVQLEITGRITAL